MIDTSRVWKPCFSIFSSFAYFMNKTRTPAILVVDVYKGYFLVDKMEQRQKIFILNITVILMHPVRLVKN